ncbi:MAG: Glutathione S-transferase, partial [uncultured Ramlibacter sp.]
GTHAGQPPPLPVRAACRDRAAGKGRALFAPLDRSLGQAGLVHRDLALGQDAGADGRRGAGLRIGRHLRVPGRDDRPAAASARSATARAAPRLDRVRLFAAEHHLGLLQRARCSGPAGAARGAAGAVPPAGSGPASRRPLLRRRFVQRRRCRVRAGVPLLRHVRSHRRNRLLREHASGAGLARSVGGAPLGAGGGSARLPAAAARLPARPRQRTLAPDRGL